MDFSVDTGCCSSWSGSVVGAGGAVWPTPGGPACLPPHSGACNLRCKQTQSAAVTTRSARCSGMGARQAACWSAAAGQLCNRREIQRVFPSCSAGDDQPPTGFGLGRLRSCAANWRLRILGRWPRSRDGGQGVIAAQQALARAQRAGRWALRQRRPHQAGPLSVASCRSRSSHFTGLCVGALLNLMELS